MYSGLFESGPDDASGTNAPSEALTETGAPSSPASTDDTGGSSVGGEMEAPRLDVAPAVGDPEPPPTCQAVDLLFVVDNSGSMGDEQLNLVASFPGFISGIRERLGSATSYHVGVVTTDAYAWDLPMCQSLGGLTVRTGGMLSSDETCGPFALGRSFMTVEDDLDEAFSCAAQVGIDGAGVERPMDAIAGVLTDPSGINSVCNEGFLRDEALLVIVLITDEEDEGDSLGHPLDWFDNVVAAKGGDADAVVVLALIGHDKPNACIATQWTGMMGAEIAPRLATFAGLFEHGTVGDVCAPDYGPFFADAVDGIADACDLVPTPAD